MIGGWAVRLELALWAAAGRRLELWWRDDDTRGPSPALDQLLELVRSFDIPLALAVAPDAACRPLAARLSSERLVTVIPQGADGPAAPVAGFRDQLELMPRLAPVFVSNGNPVTADLALDLRALGYCALSAFGENRVSEPGFCRIDAHLDLSAGDGALWRLAKLARERRQLGQWDQPIGILTRHQTHDEPAWRFLQTFLELTTSSPAVRWRGLSDLVNSPRRRVLIDTVAATDLQRHPALGAG